MKQLVGRKLGSSSGGIYLDATVRCEVQQPHGAASASHSAPMPVSTCLCLAHSTSADWKLSPSICMSQHVAVLRTCYHRFHSSAHHKFTCTLPLHSSTLYVPCQPAAILQSSLTDRGGCFQVKLRAWRNEDARLGHPDAYRVYLELQGLPQAILAAARSKRGGLWVEVVGDWSLVIHTSGARRPAPHRMLHAVDSGQHVLLNISIPRLRITPASKNRVLL
jgi:hypothetical protein